MSEQKIILPPGVPDPREDPSVLPTRDSVEKCPSCDAPKEMLLGGPRRFPVLRNKLVCKRCGQEINVDG